MVVMSLRVFSSRRCAWRIRCWMMYCPGVLREFIKRDALVQAAVNVIPQGARGALIQDRAIVFADTANGTTG